MESRRTAILGWIEVIPVAGLPLVAVFQPRWVPLLVLLIFLLHRAARGLRVETGLHFLLICIAALAAIIASRGWRTGLVALAACGFIALTAWLAEGFPGGRRPDAADFLLLLFIMADTLAHPDSRFFLAWVAPLLAGLAARRASFVTFGSRSRASQLQPPSREIRGTLSFSGALAGDDGLPRSSPLDIELRAGSSLALLCDSGAEAFLLAAHLAGRRQSPGSRLCLDGEVIGEDSRLCVLISQGEPFLPGSLEANLEVFLDRSLGAGAHAGVWEACALSDVATELDGRLLDADGEPLDRFHRMLVQAARVIPSPYRVVIAVDPVPWVNPVRGALWRAALIRACLGRTSVVLTPDRELADCMDRVLLFRHGNIRPVPEGEN